MTWTTHYNHKKTVVPKPLGIETVLLAPRDRAEVLVLLRRQRTEIPCSHFGTENEVIRSCSETISPSRGPLEYVADGDYHKQLVLSVSMYRTEEWKY